ncbi:membrane protein [Oceanococcus atlanticus]|uniref:Membrane protein n=1 Tax=Oceanococcus atlanticus TaxID=1317117 RepID=A0A1Y1SCA7_9GAMM|nr:membrane protein [Oceanococcus atlanticus]
MDSAGVNHLISGVLIAVGLIHLAPALGVLGPERLRQLYEVSVHDPDMLLLMRHRAVLFGILGAVLTLAAWHRELQPLALLAGILSTGSFILLAGGEAYNAAIRRVILIDWLALGGLLAASLLWLWRRYGM